MFFRSTLIWEEYIASPHLFFDQLHNFAPSVFEVCLVNVNALLERAVFLFYRFLAYRCQHFQIFGIFPLRGSEGCSLGLVPIETQISMVVLTWC